MTTTVFTAGHTCAHGAFHPHDSAPEVAMDARVASELLRTVGIIDRHLMADPGHAVVEPVLLAEWLSGPVPVIFQIEIDALVRLGDWVCQRDGVTGLDAPGVSRGEDLS